MDNCHRIALAMLGAALMGAGIKWIWKALEPSYHIKRLDPAMFDEQIQISETIPNNAVSKKRVRNKKKGKKASPDAGRSSEEKCIISMKIQKPSLTKSAFMAEEKKGEDTKSLAVAEIEAILKDERDVEAAAFVPASKSTQIIARGDEDHSIFDILTFQCTATSLDTTDVPKSVQPIVQVQNEQSTIQKCEAHLTDHCFQPVVEEFQIVQGRRRKTKAKEQRSSPTPVSPKKTATTLKKTCCIPPSSVAPSPKRTPAHFNVHNLEAQSVVWEVVSEEPKSAWKGWGVPIGNKKGDAMIEDGIGHEEFPPLFMSKMNKKETAKKEKEGKNSMSNMNTETPSDSATLETIQEPSVRYTEASHLETAATDTQSEPNENVLERIPSNRDIEGVADAAITVRAPVPENIVELKDSVRSMVESNLASQSESSAVQSTSTSGTITSAFISLDDNQKPEAKDTSPATSVTGDETNSGVDVPRPGGDDTNVRNSHDSEAREEEEEVSSPAASEKENSRQNSGSWADRDDDDDENGDWREDIKNSLSNRRSPSTLASTGLRK